MKVDGKLKPPKKKTLARLANCGKMNSVGDANYIFTMALARLSKLELPEVKRKAKQCEIETKACSFEQLFLGSVLDILTRRYP